jgi:hypothetical protein
MQFAPNPDTGLGASTVSGSKRMAKQTITAKIEVNSFQSGWALFMQATQLEFDQIFVLDPGQTVQQGEIGVVPEVYPEFPVQQAVNIGGLL